MGARKKSLIQRILRFKTKLYEDGEKRALDIKQMKEEARINSTK